MEVIPAINCKEWRSVKARLEQVKKLKSRWVHFDVADGKFAPVLSWNEPEKLKAKSQKLEAEIEVHLMVCDFRKEIKRWRGIAERIILHCEALGKNGPETIPAPAADCGLGIALLPNTKTPLIFPYLKKIRFIQFLAVKPGFSGQKFKKAVLEKIKTLRMRDKSVKIEVDGGINIETARLAKKAGADIAVSASFLWESENPDARYQKLLKV